MSASEINVEQEIAEIKAHMPEVYQCIKAKAEEMGKEAYALVRRGLRGEPNCFYAFERGYVKGTPFTLTDIMRDIAYLMVAYGSAHVCIFPIKEKAGTNETS